MIFSVNTAKYNTGFDFKKVGIDKLKEQIGLQLGAIEEVIDNGNLYQDCIIAKVVSKVAHPDSDHLNVCKIDVQDHSYEHKDAEFLIQVVCGAPNVEAGQTVVWIKPGAIVPSTAHDDQPFELSVRNIRGVESHGMLASPQELAMFEDHRGILVLDDQDVKIGSSLGQYFGLDDVLFDLENKMFTHRPDCFGLLGIARELVAINGQRFNSPDWYRSTIEHEVSDQESKIEYRNEATEYCPRFSTTIIRNVKVTQSPIWLKCLLFRVGIKPINNIVDFTNYVSYMLGQPMHAYDLSKLPDQTSLYPAISHDGEKLTLLGGKEIEINKGHIVIRSGETVVGLAGVMGGKDTECDDSTTDILLECAAFDMYQIRRTSMHFGLFTDAVTRYTKGQSPIQISAAVRHFIDLLKHSKPDFTVGPSVEQYQIPKVIEITTPIEMINSRLGLALKGDTIERILNSVQVPTEIEKGNVTSKVPFWRMDLETPIDIVEEVGRIYGYFNIKPKLPSIAIGSKVRNMRRNSDNLIKAKLNNLGFSAVVSYSFVHQNLLNSANQTIDDSYLLRNALSPDLHAYRQTISPMLLTKIHKNLKSDRKKLGSNSVAIYEIGKGRIKGELDPEGIPIEYNLLSLVISADQKTTKDYKGLRAFHAIAKSLDTILGHDSYQLIKVGDAPEQSKIIKAMLALLHPEIRALVKFRQKIVGVIGEIADNTSYDHKLPPFTAAVELILDEINLNKSDSKYYPKSNFPRSNFDITYTWENQHGYGASEQLLSKIENVASQIDDLHLDFKIVDTIEHDDRYKMTIRFWVFSYNTSITDQITEDLIKRFEAAGG